jgi:hypothetical protein
MPQLDSVSPDPVKHRCVTSAETQRREIMRAVNRELVECERQKEKTAQWYTVIPHIDPDDGDQGDLWSALQCSSSQEESLDSLSTSILNIFR